MKFYITVIVTIIFICFYSCKKNSGPVPPNGTISFVGIKNADTLKGNITAQLQSGSADPISKIQIFANDSLIATGSNIPYILQWNTASVVNGNYNLKAVAYLSNGKQIQTELSVVVSNILVTFIIDPHIESIFNNEMYILTDSAGNVLNSVKYNGTDQILKIGATKAYLNSRFNIFWLRTNPAGSTYITAHIDVPVGSDWNTSGEKSNPSPAVTSQTVMFSNVPSFTRITTSSDIFGLTDYSLANVANYSNFIYSPTSKIFVQLIDNNNIGHYNFFDVDTTQKSRNIDLSNSLTNTSIKQITTIPGATSGEAILYGKSDKIFDDYYLIDTAPLQGSTFSYFYPSNNMLTDYNSYVYFLKNGYVYINTYKQLLPTTITPLAATVNLSANTLNNLTFTTQGVFNYSDISFSNSNAKVYADIYLTKSNYSFKFPDILKLTNIPNVSPNDFKIYSFGMFSVSGFQENNLFYYTNVDYSGYTVQAQSAILYFN